MNDNRPVKVPTTPPGSAGVTSVPPPVPPANRPAALAPIGAEQAIDRMAHAALGRATLGFSPMALWLAALDWGVHLAVSPGRQAALVREATGRAGALWGAMSVGPEAVGEHPAKAARPNDPRFRAEEWAQWPFSLWAAGFLAGEKVWDAATSQVHGASAHHLALMNFVGRQALDMASPSNFVLTNPVLLRQTLTEGGANLARGAANYAADLQRVLRRERSAAAKAFRPGETVAVTPGAVVRRTRLAEIIQYRPTTPDVHGEPVVIVPAWIMKYYILDLRPQNSLIKHLVDAGFTVFCVSWRNPTSEDRDVGFDDYRREGALAALEAALAITGASKAHFVGYCIGGTLATIAAAAMARDGDDRLESLTLFAAQTDFDEAGELRTFIDDSQLALLEDLMWEDGTLEASQMAGAFDLMRSVDLIWSRVVHHYLMGEPERLDELNAWSTDATRMPYRMHSEYLRSLYLDDDLSEGRFEVDGRRISLRDIRAPIFAVGAELDHVAPWRSVFKIHNLVDAEVTFALASGGHNRGIVAPPGEPKAHLRLATTSPEAPRPDPEAWALAAEYRAGSWWPAWFDWLARRSSGRAPPPPLGRPEAGYPPLAPAPGEFVRG